jgi:hypothetical protein
MPYPRETFRQGTVGTFGDFVTHQDSDLIELLPLSIKGQQSTDFKVSGGNIKFVRDF